MKHILVNNNGQVHAVIIGCPFKYTAPRGLTVYEDINHNFAKQFNATGKKSIDTFHFTNPKNQDDINKDAINFAIIKDGVIDNCVMWGGAEWVPPMGTILTPLDKWMGVNDTYKDDTQSFIINNERIGKRDTDKTVQELQEDMDAVLNLAEILE